MDKNIMCYNISNDKLSKLKQVTRGTDGIIYKLDKEHLLKIYNRDVKVKNTIEDENDEIIKTKKPSHFKNTCNYQSYCYDEDGVRLGYDQIIKEAQDKQKKVTLTTLPLLPAYIDGSFKGCVLKYHKHYYPISNFSFLPIKLKLKIAQNILMKIKELLNNNIYAIDLYNKSDNDNAHSNIIVNLKLDTQIIDLDGQSVAYTGKYNKDFYQQTLFGLTTLLMEFIYDQDLHDYFEEPYSFVEYYKNYFQNRFNIENYYIENLFSENIDINILEKFINKKK